MNFLIQNLVFVALAWANQPLSPTSVTHEQLCTYDHMCRSVRTNGQPLRPKLNLTGMIQQMADPILEYSKQYDVDPRAVAGAILAENTMNVQIDDALQNWLVKNNVWGSKALLEKGMSIGAGQINMPAALAAEAHIASKGIRPARSQEEVQKRLLTLGGAAEYSAMITRQAQDIYQDKGIDVKGKPGLLATLYNLGRYESLAQQSKVSGKAPRPNYFGFFVEENLKDVEEAIGWSPERGLFRKSRRVLAEAGNIGQVSDGELDLATAPPQCRTQGRGQDSEINSRQSWERFSNFKVTNVRYAEVLAKGLDCIMREWVQVRTNRGDIGWMLHQDFATEAVELEPITADAKKMFGKGREIGPDKMEWTCSAANKSCEDRALKAYGAEKYSMMDGKGYRYLPVKRRAEEDPANSRQPVAREERDQFRAIDCQRSGEMDYQSFKARSYQMAGIPYQAPVQAKPANQPLNATMPGLNSNLGFPGGGGMYNGKAPEAISAEEISKLGSELAAQKTAIISQLKLAAWNDPKNPFMASFQRAESVFRDCGGSRSKDYICQVFGKDNLVKFAQTDFAKIKNLKALQDTNASVMNLNYNQVMTPEAIKRQNEQEEINKKRREAELTGYIDRYKKSLVGLKEKSIDWEKNKDEYIKKAEEEQKKQWAIEDETRKANIEKVKPMFAAAMSTCEIMEEASPELYKEIKGMVNSVAENLDIIDRYIITDYVKFLQKFEPYCEQIWMAHERKTKGVYPVSGEASAPCEFYRDPNSYYGNNNSPLLTYAMDLLVAMDLGPEDHRKLMADHLEETKRVLENLGRTRKSVDSARKKTLVVKNPFEEQIKSVEYDIQEYSNMLANRSSGSNYRAGYNDSGQSKEFQQQALDAVAQCNYNYLDTAKAVEKLAQVNCVQTVLVGDPQVLKGMMVSSNARIVTDPTIPGDSIAFTFANECKSRLYNPPATSGRPTE